MVVSSKHDLCMAFMVFVLQNMCGIPDSDRAKRIKPFSIFRITCMVKFFVLQRVSFYE